VVTRRLKPSGARADLDAMVPTRARSLPDCRPLLADPDDLTLVFQPIVDLAGGTVAGYETLARFPGTAGPDVWFAAGAGAGLAGELEALLVHKALSRLPVVPPGTFLLLPVRAHLLSHRLVQAAFATRPRLDGLVVEVRPTDGAEDPEASARAIGAVRARGAAVAVVSAARPDQLPDLVVLDREGVSALRGDEVVIGATPGAPRLLADGIDTADDLTAALRSGAGLARGWLFGLPSARPEPLASSVTDLVRVRRARVRRADAVLPLVRPVRSVPAPAAGPGPAVEVDLDGTPVALLAEGPSGSTWRTPITLRVVPTAGVGDTLRFALSRPAENRYDPVLCTDEAGRPLGLLRVADLVRAANG